MTIADDFASGINAINSLYNTKMTKEQAGRYPEELDLEMDKMRLANLYQGLVNEYYGPKMQADIGLTGAQTRSWDESTRLAPLETLIKAQQANQQSSRFGAAYEMARALNAMDPAARATWISQNQESYNQLLSDLGNKQGGQNSLLTPQVLRQFLPGIQIGQQPQGLAAPAPAPAVIPPGGPAPMQPMIPPQKMPVQNPIMGAPAQGMGAPMPAPTPPARYFAPSTPAQVDQVRLANQIAANNKLTTAATRRQMEGAIQVENIINDPQVQNQVQNAAEYAGAMRKGKAFTDALSQTNPKAYEDYIAFKDQTMVLLLNRIKTLDQMGATNEQRDELHGLYDKTMDAFSSNPQQFITQFNKLGQSLNTVARSVQKSATPISNVNRLEGFNPIPEKGSDNMVRVQLPDGRTGKIPASNLSAAIKQGAKRID